MNLKIKTKDIEIDYKDGYSMLEEAAKLRLIAISESIMTHQLSIEQVRREQEELKEINTIPNPEHRLYGEIKDVLHQNKEEKPKSNLSWDDVLDSRGGQRYPIGPDPKVEDPMWFAKAKQGQITDEFIEGYSQAVYQIRLLLSSLTEEPTGEIREYTQKMLAALSEAYKESQRSMRHWQDPNDIFPDPEYGKPDWSCKYCKNRETDCNGDCLKKV